MSDAGKAWRARIFRMIGGMLRQATVSGVNAPPEIQSLGNSFLLCTGNLNNSIWDLPQGQRAEF